MILNSQSASGAPVGDHVPGLVAVPMGFGGLRDGRLFPLVEDSEHLCLLSAPNRAMSVMKRLVRLRIRSRTSRRTFALESPGLSRSISRHIVFQLEARRWLTSLGMSRRMVSTLLQSLYHRRRRWCRRSFGGRSEDREQFGLGRCRKLCLQTTDAHSLGGRAKRGRLQRSLCCVVLISSTPLLGRTAVGGSRIKTRQHSSDRSDGTSRPGPAGLARAIVVEVLDGIVLIDRL